MKDAELVAVAILLLFLAAMGVAASTTPFGI